MTTSAHTAPESGLELQPDEREVLLEEIRPFAGTLKDPTARERYLNRKSRAAE